MRIRVVRGLLANGIIRYAPCNKYSGQIEVRGRVIGNQVDRFRELRRGFV
jgi:hypothetical protein